MVGQTTFAISGSAKTYFDDENDDNDDGGGGGGGGDDDDGHVGRVAAKTSCPSTVNPGGRHYKKQRNKLPQIQSLSLFQPIFMPTYCLQYHK